MNELILETTTTTTTLTIYATGSTYFFKQKKINRFMKINKKKKRFNSQNIIHYKLRLRLFIVCIVLF